MRSSAPAPQHWTEGRVGTERCGSDGNPPAQGRALVWVVAVKRAPFGFSVTGTILSISNYHKHPSAPCGRRIYPRAPKQQHSQCRWLFTQPDLAAPGSSLSCSHCIRRYCFTIVEKKRLKTKKFTRKILACRFSAQVRLGLLCKWLGIRLSRLKLIKPFFPSLD